MPNRAGELVWDGDKNDASKLSRDRIVREAIAIADQEGLDAVSIRNIAAKLRARPMSLYSHVASKDDLVALMLNEVSTELLISEPEARGWREALKEIARAAFRAYRAHPWMLGVFGQGARVGPNQLRRAEQSAAAVESLSSDPSDRWMALGLVHEWTIGHAMHVITLREDVQLRQHLEGASPKEFPHMAEVFRRSGEQDDAVFEAALDVVLSGIAHQLN